MDKKNHWENIYQTKDFTEVSWYQQKPATSLSFLEKLSISKNDKIIDIGGGDSYFVDHLLDLGYNDITVLDISEAALKKAKERLRNRANEVKWAVADAANFIPSEQYDFWHDRAAFHFLTNEKDIESYVSTVSKALAPGGKLVVGTFSENGPEKCSGIPIHQYSETSLQDRFKDNFKKLECFTVDHKTPFNTVQNFVFCSFEKVAFT